MLIYCFGLKTFSINAFQGQYPNVAVRIITTPINPRIHPEIPEIRKAKTVRTTPMADRKISSPLPTFFVLIQDPISPPLITNAIGIKLSHFLSRNWVLNSFPAYITTFWVKG
jgi:hypothetical protein